MNKKFLPLLALLFFSASVFATILVATFGFGLTNLIPFFSPNKITSTNPAQFYYATLDGWTATPTNALAFERFDSNGSLHWIINANTGGCNWFGLVKETVPTVNDTHYALDNLDELPVRSGQNLYWALKPQTANVQVCRLDYNVSVITQ